MFSLLAVSGALAAAGVALNSYRRPPRPGLPAEPGARASAPRPATPPALSPSGVIRVHMVGAIRQPGVYSLPASARVLDGITLAGGATSRADLDRINLADFLKDGEQVRVPVLGGTEAAGAHRPTAEPAFVPAGAGGKAKGRYPFASSPTTGTSARGASGSGRVHLNAAGKADLERLPGVGPATAARILAYRSQYGPFERVEDLMNVTGIGRKRLEEMRPLLAVP